MPAVEMSGEVSLTFVHVPKSAGTSIGRWMNKHKGNSSYYEWYDHPTLKMIKRDTSAHPSFTVVRNPWDRMVSFYHFLSNVESANPQFTSQQVQWVINESNKGFDWSSFDKWINNIERFTIIPGWWFTAHEPQTSWYKDVDIILRYENLDEDFKQIQSMFNIQDPLPRTLVSNRSGYQKYYNTDTKDKVSKMFQEEIETLKYSF
jgi:hypothetical protein